MAPSPQLRATIICYASEHPTEHISVLEQGRIIAFYSDKLEADFHLSNTTLKEANDIIEFIQKNIYSLSDLGQPLSYDSTVSLDSSLSFPLSPAPSMELLSDLDKYLESLPPTQLAEPDEDKIEASQSPETLLNEM